MEPWQQKVAEWRKSPRTFIREALGAEPDEWQDQDVLIPLEQGKRRIAIRAGHGVGKTALEAWLILWFLLFYRPCKIPVTANSQDQLRDVVWAEIAKWWRRLPDFLKDMIEVGAEKVFIKADPEGAFAVARTARPERPEALQGFHSENLMFVLEEASGIEDVIFETAGGALTGPNAVVVMAGNPTRLQGYFFRAFHGNRQHWHCVHVPCSRASHVDPGYPAQIAEEYGRDSNVYRVRVDGEFPSAEANTVIPLDLIESAKGRNVTTSDVWPIWGLDPGRFGDDASALVARQGNTVLSKFIREWRNLDGPQLSGRVINLYNETIIPERPREIVVDIIGIGCSAYDHMRLPGSPVREITRGVNVAEASTASETEDRLRSELWFRGHAWFHKKDCRIEPTPYDPAATKLIEKLVGELSAPTYEFNRLGKRVVEKKEDMKKRGVPSPNLADAFLLTLAGGTYPRTNPHRRRAEQNAEAGWLGA